MKPRRRARETDARKLLPKLRALLKDPHAILKSALQADISAIVLEASEDMLVFMGTGSGKSLCVLLPAFMEGKNYSSIIITALAALVGEWTKKCRQLGITVASWQERGKCRVQIYVFSSENVDTAHYRIFDRTLSSQGLLKRLVYDEAHGAIIWDDFRVSMFKSRFMLSCASRPVQRVLLSATVPPFERGNLLMAYGMREAYLYTAPTVRSNLSFCVEMINGSAVGDGCGALLKALSRSLRSEIRGMVHSLKSFRIMVFVIRISDATAVRSEIKSLIEQERNGALFVYHGKLSAGERLRIQNEWDSDIGRPIKVIISTSAFGAGVDKSNIKLIYHFGGCESLLKYAQECGRGGRGGEAARYIFLWSDVFAKRQETIRSKKACAANLLWEKDYEERKYLWWSEVRKWVQNASKCRKASLFEYLDGIEVSPCFYERSCNPCDVCVRITAETSQREARTVDVEMEMITPSKREDRAEMPQTFASPAKFIVKKMPFTHEEPVISEKRPGDTMTANHRKDVSVRNETLELMTRFEVICSRIDGLCLLCLVLQGVEIMSCDSGRCVSCSEKSGRWYKCLSSQHRSSDCVLPLFVKNHCNNCGLNKLDSKDAHRGTGFAKACPRPHLNRVFWLLLSKKETREEMITELCTTRQRSNLSSLLSNQGPYARRTIETVVEWLHNETGTPMHVRVLCWWDARSGNL